MGSRPAPDRYELAGVDELRELAVSLLRLQKQKLLDIAPFDFPSSWRTTFIMDPEYSTLSISN